MDVNWRKFWNAYDRWLEEERNNLSGASDVSWKRSVYKMCDIFAEQNARYKTIAFYVHASFQRWWKGEKKRLKGRVRWRNDVGFVGIPTWSEQKRKLEELMLTYAKDKASL